MLNNLNYYTFVTFLCVLGYFFWVYPEGMNRVLIFINLQIKLLYIETIKIYYKWTMLRQLNKMNKDMGLPPIPWNHKKGKSLDS